MFWRQLNNSINCSIPLILSSVRRTIIWLPSACRDSYLTYRSDRRLIKDTLLSHSRRQDGVDGEQYRSAAAVWSLCRHTVRHMIAVLYISRQYGNTMLRLPKPCPAAEAERNLANLLPRETVLTPVAAFVLIAAIYTPYRDSWNRCVYGRLWHW
jgi:hypothetical protein